MAAKRDPACGAEGASKSDTCPACQDRSDCGADTRYQLICAGNRLALAAPSLSVDAGFLWIGGFLWPGSFGIVEAMAIRIRSASDSDRDQILALAQRLTEGVAEWRDADAVKHAVTGWVQDSLDGSHHDNQTVLVADLDGAVGGFVSVGTKEHWSGSLDGYIGELVVSHEAEGAGIGSALIQAAVEWSRDQELERVSVDTGAANSRARYLYKRLGFDEEDITLSIATSRLVLLSHIELMPNVR